MQGRSLDAKRAPKMSGSLKPLGHLPDAKRVPEMSGSLKPSGHLPSPEDGPQLLMASHWPPINGPA